MRIAVGEKLLLLFHEVLLCCIEGCFKMFLQLLEDDHTVLLCMQQAVNS